MGKTGAKSPLSVLNYLYFPSVTLPGKLFGYPVSNLTPLWRYSQDRPSLSLFWYLFKEIMNHFGAGTELLMNFKMMIYCVLRAVPDMRLKDELDGTLAQDEA